jgi:hypothetical protein
MMSTEQLFALAVELSRLPKDARRKLYGQLDPATRRYLFDHLIAPASNDRDLDTLVSTIVDAGPGRNRVFRALTEADQRRVLSWGLLCIHPPGEWSAEELDRSHAMRHRRHDHLFVEETEMIVNPP